MKKKEPKVIGKSMPPFKEKPPKKMKQGKNVGG